MKTILSSRRYHYLVMASIFLMVVALIAGMVSCDGDGESYALAITSTAAGNVTTPGEGMFVYNAGTVVDLVATPDVGYCFVNWTGDVGTIANVNAAATNIIMNGDYLITANFGLFAGGDGTVEYPYRIADWWCLNNARDYLSSHFIVINDLDSNSAGYIELASTTANEGKGWEPIGTEDDAFAGDFDGQGYEICDLFINRPDEYYVGLFGAVDYAVIQNIGVVNVDVTGHYGVGGLMGWASRSQVNDSYSTGGVSVSGAGGGLVGGLVGFNTDSEVSHSYSTGNVTGGGGVGGLVGATMGISLEATVSNSYATGSVTGDNIVGGLVGGMVGDMGGSTVSNSYATGSVTGNNDVGGLVGRKEKGTVSNSFWDTETSGWATSAGGVGKTTEEMQNIATFSGAGWDIIAVALNETNSAYNWNIVDSETYPFLSWEL